MNLHEHRKTVNAKQYCQPQEIDCLQVESAINEIRRELRNGMWENAHDVITQLRRDADRIDPENAELDPYIRRATINMERGRLDLAIQALTEAYEKPWAVRMPTPEEVWSWQLTQLGLRHRIIAGLDRAGISTVGQLLKHSRAQLRAINHFGTTSISEVCAAVDKIRSLMMHYSNLAKLADPGIVHPDWQRWIVAGEWPEKR